MDLISFVLPEPDGRLIVCDADGEPTDDKIPSWVRRALRAAEAEGLVPGSYIALWTDTPEAGVRVAGYDDGEEASWPFDLAALWMAAEAP